MIPFTAAQADVVQSWLDGVAYKPGFLFRAEFHALMETIEVHLEALLFDSTRPERTKVLRNRSIRAAIPAPASLATPSAVLEEYSYDVGPDLVGGPLVRIGRSTTLPPYLDVPEPGQASADQMRACRRAFLAWLRRELHDLEAHESDEWLRDKESGKVFFDPHAQDRT